MKISTTESFMSLKKATELAEILNNDVGDFGEEDRYEVVVVNVERDYAKVAYYDSDGIFVGHI
jgi:hypothetical protein